MTPTSALDATAAAFRAALLRRDEAALKRLMAAYQPASTRMQARVAALTAQIARAEADGTPVRPSWLVERGRLETLQRQIVGEWARFADEAEAVITDAQRAAVAAAHTEAHQLTLAALHAGGVTTGADVVRLPVAAMHDLIGVLGDGSPLRSLLDRLGQQAAQDVGAALTHAVTVGRNPRQTARDIRDALGGDLNRALTIARTEQMRAYRSASLRNYQANSELLRGWRWLASPSRRTCPVCLAMDGTEHGLDEPFASHIRCRCTPVPVLRDAPAVDPDTTGAAWFAKQPADVQRAMLGPGKHALYQEGKLTLADLVGVKEDARWGRSRYQRSLREIQAGGGVASRVSNSPGVVPGGAGGASGAGTPPIKPGRFVSLDVAKAWATQQYPHITWDFEGAHINAINPTLEQFHKLAQQWPEVVKQLDYVGTHQGLNALYPELKTWDNAYAHADGGTLGKGKFIGLNPLHYGNPTRFKALLQTDVQTGFHPKGSDRIEATLTHEFGHLVDVWLRSRRNAFRSVVDDDGFGMAHATFHLWMNANKAGLDLSRYATEKEVEGWAEGFTAVYHMPWSDWPIFVQRMSVLLRMVRDQRPSYKSLRGLMLTARTIARKSLDRDRKRVGL